MELLGVIIGAATGIFASWATLWYKLGKLQQKVDHCNQMTEALQKQMEHLLTTRLYHCDSGEEK